MNAQLTRSNVAIQMAYLRLQLAPLSAFGTPLKGDTLFGQLCWALVNRHGAKRLDDLLVDYTDGKPFAVVSDAFPSGHWPRPILPQRMFGEADPAERKQARMRIWLPHPDFESPVSDWLSKTVENPDCGPATKNEEESRFAHTENSIIRETRTRNSIDRRTGTTGQGFDPYATEEQRFCEGTYFDLHIVYDAARVDASDILVAMRDIGALGYGRDASIGLGRFRVVEDDGSTKLCGAIKAQDNANAWLTLAPFAPQGLSFNPEQSWYRPFTRFGRHGDRAVMTGKPFKAPLLLADTGAVMTCANGQFRIRPFIGQGLGGSQQSISRAIPETVHQGYAPVLGIHVPVPPHTCGEEAR